MIPIIERSHIYKRRTAIIDPAGRYSYETLYATAVTLAGHIIREAGADPGPVLFLFPSGFQYVAVQWAIWMAGGIAVPVHTAHPPEEIRYLLEDTGSRLLLFDEPFKGKAAAGSRDSHCLCLSLKMLAAGAPVSLLPEIPLSADALMIYTSGTTGRPKGVVMTHEQIDAQIRSLSEAWGWHSEDRILNVLPMHHVHGVINITCCALYNGAVLEMMPHFDPAHTAARMSSGALTLFMAVPTIYHKLIGYFEQLTAGQQNDWQKGMQQMRLMVSGSAALPVPVLERWQRISGHTLLERYGMTEIGMALSNPLNGIRRPGYVGYPLPLVRVMLADENGAEIHGHGQPGELYVSGSTVFKRYWNRPEETRRSFSGPWFRTGDIAERDSGGCYKILGRSSSDIIKTGGYKVSALEIEHVLLAHPSVQECAVVALPSEEWGEIIAAAVVGPSDPTPLQSWVADKLAPYKLPRKWLCTGPLPRNAMGKVLKKEIRELFT